MKSPLSQEIILLQHQLMMVLGMTPEPDDMLQNFCQQAITCLQLKAVYVDHKENTETEEQARSTSYLHDQVQTEQDTLINEYKHHESPKESAYISCLNIGNDYWYCFSLKNIGYMALIAVSPFSTNDIIPALAEVIQRMSKTYAGRKQFIVNEKQRREIKKISNSLHAEKLKFEHILRSIKDCILVLDIDGNIYFTNLAANGLFGETTGAMLSKHFTEYFRIYDLESREDITRSIVEHSTEHGKWSDPRPVILKTSKGKEFYVRLNVKSMSEDGIKRYFVSTFHDMTESYKLEQKLQWQATHDALTGCLNRHGFGEKLKHLLDNRSDGAHLSFVSIDLDRFKLINDISGHPAGDALLKLVVQLIEHNASDQGILARLGGDEFGVIFPNSHPSAVEAITEAIRHSIDRLRFKWDDNIFTIGASIGIAHVGDEETDMNEVFIRADEACLMSKENGRNQITIAPAAVRSATSQRDNIPRELSRNYLHYINRALTDSDKDYKLVLYKQDIRSISEEAYGDHHEVLLRLIHNGVVIPPDSFLPAAERSGIVRDIDLFVLEKTLKHLTNNQGDYFNVNLSGISLSDGVARDRIFNLISQHPIEAKCLCLEVTETAAITNLTECIRFMEKLNELGVNFALDDFGTGVSSFSYLKSLPVKYLKIDGSFIRDICSNEIDEIVVQSIVSASKAMNIRTVAEYVSDGDILEKVTALGVDYAQGYWVNIPSKLH